MSNFDFTGMDVFWQIFATLRAGREPSPEEWDRLFATPGYAVLTRSEFSREFFIHRFRLAFKPELAGELEDALGRDRLGVLRHYVKVRDNPGLVRKQQQVLAQSDFYSRVMEECLEWLPFDEVEEYPPVAFVIFQNDARGYSPVVVDVLAAVELGEFIPLFLAHEFHHWYRNRVLALDWAKAPAGYQDLVWVLDQIHMEGLADNIDKAALMAAGHPFARGFAGMVEKAPEYIGLLGDVLTRVAKGEEDVSRAGRLLREKLPQAGHPVGYYMAREIIAAWGKESLVETTGNPFEFFLRYGDLPAEALAWLRELEKLVAVQP